MRDAQAYACARAIVRVVHKASLISHFSPDTNGFSLLFLLNLNLGFLRMSQKMRKLDGWLTAAKALFCDTIVLASHEMVAEGVKH